jgi:hypothetical protein
MFFDTVEHNLHYQMPLKGHFGRNCDIDAFGMEPSIVPLISDKVGSCLSLLLVQGLATRPDNAKEL